MAELPFVLAHRAHTINWIFWRWAVLGGGAQERAAQVVWQLRNNDIVAVVIAQHKTPFGHKMVIPMKTVALFPTDDEDKAHYLCAVINSIPVREFIKSYSSAGRGFGAPSVMNHVGIPKFDPINELHKKLAQVPKSLHELKRTNVLEKSLILESHNDELVGKLFGLKG